MKIKKKKVESKKDSKNEVCYEEIEFICPNCGKKVKMLKVKGVSIEGLLCQRCSQGEVQQSDFG